VRSALVILAHPHFRRSIAQRALVDAVRDLPGVRIHALYDVYPDLSIDVAAEQALLAAADLVVWQHPLYWYSTPALLTLWFEAVLERDWAYGPDGNALSGKACLWVVSTGAGEDAYQPHGTHAHPFEAFVPAVRQTARFCGMQWLEPIVVHAAHARDRTELDAHAGRYRARLKDWVDGAG
jgi:glutathione-regulated potassium-efflux system ancillary protein KefF